MEELRGLIASNKDQSSSAQVNEVLIVIGRWIEIVEISSEIFYASESGNEIDSGSESRNWINGVSGIGNVSISTHTILNSVKNFILDRIVENTVDCLHHNRSSPDIERELGYLRGLDIDVSIHFGNVEDEEGIKSSCSEEDDHLIKCCNDLFDRNWRRINGQSNYRFSCREIVNDFVLLSLESVGESSDFIGRRRSVISHFASERTEEIVKFSLDREVSRNYIGIEGVNAISTAISTQTI